MNENKMCEFISVLRKAKGLTQKDIADKLCISNKTVSRWERGDTLPDLSVITDLADLLGVTVDELLKGEKIRNEHPADKKETAKHVESIARRIKINYISRISFSIAAPVLGFILFFILAFMLDVSLVGICVCVSASVISILFAFSLFLNAYNSVSEDDFKTVYVEKFKHSAINTFAFVVYLNIVIIFCLVPTQVNLMGTNTQNLYDWAKELPIYIITAVVICSVISFVISKILSTRSGFSKEYTTMQKNNSKLKLKAVIIACISIISIFILQGVITTSIEKSFEKEVVFFDTFDEFKDFAQTSSANESPNDATLVILNDINGNEYYYLDMNDDISYFNYDNKTMTDFKVYIKGSYDYYANMIKTAETIITIIIFAGLILPFIIYLLKKDKLPWKKGIKGGDIEQ